MDDDRQLEKAKRHIASCSLICLDTEYDSFRYFHERLCLVQIKAQDEIYLIDPLARIDFASFRDIMSDQAILKIMHAGDNDIRILKRDYLFQFNNIFDTQRAASILGCRYLSLATLVKEYLDIEFEKKKKLQRSQWEVRPLSDDQLNYAVRDTVYLTPLYETLAAEAAQKGLTPALEKIFDHMTKAAWREKPFDMTGCRRIKGYYELTPDQKHCAKALYVWRYRKAKEINRAVFMILSDQELIDIAFLHPVSLSDLELSGKFAAAKIGRYGGDIIDTVSTFSAFALP